MLVTKQMVLSFCNLWPKSPPNEQDQCSAAAFWVKSDTAEVDAARPAVSSGHTGRLRTRNLTRKVEVHLLEYCFLTFHYCFRRAESGSHLKKPNKLKKKIDFWNLNCQVMIWTNLLAILLEIKWATMMIFIGSVGGFMHKQTSADVKLMHVQTEWGSLYFEHTVWSPSQSQCLW